MLESELIDSLFARLAARYGSLWFSKWDGIPINDVRVDWARVLANTSGRAIVYALENLPLEFPPTASQFREICIHCPARPTPPLLDDEVKPDLPRLVQMLERLHETAKDVGPKDWLAVLKARRAAGEPLSPGQLQAIANVEQAAATLEDEDPAKLAALKAASARRVHEYARSNGIELP